MQIVYATTGGGFYWSIIPISLTYAVAYAIMSGFWFTELELIDGDREIVLACFLLATAFFWMGDSVKLQQFEMKHSYFVNV